MVKYLEVVLTLHSLWTNPHRLTLRLKDYSSLYHVFTLITNDLIRTSIRILPYQHLPVFYIKQPKLPHSNWWPWKYIWCNRHSDDLTYIVCIFSNNSHFRLVFHNMHHLYWLCTLAFGTIINTLSWKYHGT